MKNTAYLLPVLCLATLAAATMPAHADGLNLTPDLGKTLSATIEPYASNENNGSFFVGLTQVNLSLGHTSLGSIEAFCDDFTHEISTPDTYNVKIEAVAGNQTLEEEAYYGTMFGSTPSGNATLDSDIQELIWNFTAPKNDQYALNNEMKILQAEMLANYSSANYSDDFYLDAGNGGQSFMVVTDPPSTSPVPEPSTLATFGTGLFAVAGFARRRFVRS
jgi:PEP-CTERM motif